MGTSSKQVMDIKVTKGLASVGNEELRDWTEKGWNQAMREGNYDRSREHLNFEIRPAEGGCARCPGDRIGPPNDGFLRCSLPGKSGADL